MLNTPFLILTFYEKIIFYSYYLLSCILYIIFSLVTIALFTVVERKIMAALQKRKGPNVHGIWGSLQAFADGLKLLLKEDFVPATANAFLFRAAPIYTFFIALSSWAVLPFSLNQSYFFSNLGILYIFALSSLGVYGIILSGWASNSKYSFLGSLRSAAQMISYEVSLGFIIITLCMLCGSLSLNKFVLDQVFFWFIIPFFPLFFIFFISIVAETNRAPFDLPEAEAELVSGYNVEYGGISFALFFLAEYSNIILMSTLLVLLFLGGWWPIMGVPFFAVIDTAFNFYFVFWLSLKVQVILGIFVWLRVSFPRYRYDQLMFLGWNVLLPFSLSLFFSYSIFLFYYDCLPAYHFYSHPNYVYYCTNESKDSFERFFYSWDRIHEFDQAEEEEIKENIALSDIQNYKQDVKAKLYSFERSYWQKLFFLDNPKKYSEFYQELFNLEGSKQKLSELLEENFDVFSHYETYSASYEKSSILDNIRQQQVQSANVPNFINLLLQRDEFSCSTKQCFSYFVDPNFNISDVYARTSSAIEKGTQPLTPEEAISLLVLRDCFSTWDLLHTIIINNLKIVDIEIYKIDNVKTLFFFYNSKLKKLPEDIENVKQSALTLQFLLGKYEYIKEKGTLDFINNIFRSINNTSIDDMDDAQLYKLALEVDPSIFDLEDLEFFSLSQDVALMEQLRLKLALLNDFIAIKDKESTLQNKNLTGSSKGVLTIEITLKKKI